MITLTLNLKSRKPMYQQIYEYLRQEIENGNIRAHEKMASKRKLATYLKVSQTTVETAYGQLKAEGYLYAKAKSGYYAEAIPLCTLLPQSKKETSSLLKKEEASNEDYLYDFKTGSMDVESFPFSLWSKLTREVLNEDKQELLNAIDPKGYLPLRQEIVKYLREYRGMRVAAEQVVIGAGWEYLLGLMVQLLGRDRTYGVEDPGYGKLAKILRKNDCHFEFLPLDAEGVSLASLEKSNVDAVHVTPSHQFPLGIVTSANRRRGLLSWAEEKEHRYIIEDDYDSEFRFYGRPIPAMYGLSQGEHVIYMKTLTKSLAPSLRIAYMVLPPSLMASYEKEMSFYASTVPSIEQHVLYRFMAGGYFERHLHRLRTQYRKRREQFIETIKEHSLSSKVHFIRENGGMHLLLQVDSLTEKDLVTKAGSAGIRIYGLSEYYGNFPGTYYPNAVVCGFSGFDEGTLKTAVSKLLASWL